MPSTFKTLIKIRFNHIDAAGIVFYPRYYEMFNQVVEEWFEREIGYDFHDLDEQFDAGVPTVDCQASFPNPSRLGDVLIFELMIKKLGTSSIELSINASLDDELRVQGRLLLVYIKKLTNKRVKAQAIPGFMLDKMRAFVD